jgi:anaerobic dimethyl sulfoxide reductase subunit A
MIEPLFESRSSAWLDAEFCKRFELDPRNALSPVPAKQTVYEKLLDANVRKTDGSGAFEPLLSFSADEINEIGAVGTPSPAGHGRISYTEFKEKGYYQVPRATNDGLANMGFFATYVADEDHDTELLATETGKMEIYSMKLARDYKDFGFETFLYPIAKYQEAKRGYEESLTGDYPLQMVTVHPLTRMHSGRYDNRHIQELHTDLVYINHIDAEKYGTPGKPSKSGDTVLFSSRVGKMLRRVAVISTIVPGTILTTEGATSRYNEDETIDLGGNPNSLCEDILCGEGHIPFNTTLVKMEPWAGEPMKPNYQWDHDNVSL